ncbi:MAG TPA: ABC transporter permease [Streptosporangiaceae bacterium]
MTRFLVRRILQGLFVLWLMTVTVFLIFFVGPGPSAVARVLAGRQATAVQVAQVAHRLLLDRPIPVQYWHFFKLLVFHGNLGYDYYHGSSVNSVIAAAFPITLSLVVGSAILWLALGLASGIVSAVKTRSVWDRTFTTLALVFYSMPTFVLGLLLILGLYYELTIHHIGIFPAPGTWVPFSQNPAKWAQALILPWITLALVSAATYTRLTRGSMLEVFSEDYIRTARSKGMSERRLILRHNLRSSLTPVVTQFGLDVGVLIGGAIITETVFGLPGLGYVAITGILQQDLPVVIGVVIVASAGVIIANLIVDIFYAVLDPRVRLH